MHRKSQDIYKRLVGSSGRTKSWTDDKIKRFADRVYEEAPPCLCGCGEKVNPTSGTSGTKTIAQQFRAFLSNESAIIEYKKHIRYHERYLLPASYELTHNERQALIASVLGDGSFLLPYKHNDPKPRFVWNMGNEAHTLYKKDFFSHFSHHYEKRVNGGFGAFNYRLRLNGHPCLSSLYSELYLDGKKNITQDWLYELDDFGWAWLYGDDGHLCKTSQVCHLHTEGYGEDVANYYANALDRMLNRKNSAMVYAYKGGHKNKLRYSVKLKGVANDEFMERVRPHMATGMEYKVTGRSINRKAKFKS